MDHVFGVDGYCVQCGATYKRCYQAKVPVPCIPMSPGLIQALRAPQNTEGDE
jgi:hypothetical protein